MIMDVTFLALLNVNLIRFYVLHFLQLHLVVVQGIHLVKQLLIQVVHLTMICGVINIVIQTMRYIAVNQVDLMVAQILSTAWTKKIIMDVTILAH